MSNNKINYNQYKPEEVTFGNALNDFINENFDDKYQDIVVHFENDPVIIAKNTADLYYKLSDYSVGNWSPDAIISIEVRGPEYSNSIAVEAIHW